MNEYEKIEAVRSHDGQVLRLLLNAPKANVLDRQMMVELTDAIQQGAGDFELRALLLEGKGAHFSFGASVPEHRKEQVGEMLPTFHRLLRTMIESGKPTVALVRGQCLGGALELAALCHWVFAAIDARFGQPEINLAVFPPAASLILPYRIGQSAADDLILSGRSITAEEAMHLGLVRSISDDPESDVDAFLREHILTKSGAALHFAALSSRYEMNRALLRNLEAVEELYLNDLMNTADANEGIQAFIEKRKPVWAHR
jgi:cyclohexa-1,5-dienecarbonyl-CoA hydratase